MPPKQQPKTAGKGSKKGGDDIDAILSEYTKQVKKDVAASSSTAGGAAAAPPSASLTLIDRKRSHQALKEQQEREKASAAERQIEQRLQHQKLQAMLKALMEQPRPFLNSPSTALSGTHAASAHLTCGWGAMQGWRVNMEDAHIMLPDFASSLAPLLPTPASPTTPSNVDLSKARGLFAVFDGHSGDQAAKKCGAALPALIATSIRDHYGAAIGGLSSPAPLLARQVEGCDVPFPCDGGAGVILHNAYKRLDDALLNKVTDDSGATAVTVIVTDKHVVCASVGDSRAVLCRKDGKATPLSFDHKPDDAEEKARIEAAGGSVSSNRVNGRLAMSRAVGDHSYKADKGLPYDKQLVTCVPDVRIAPLQEAGVPMYDYLIVACDGIFDVLSNDELCQLVKSKLAAMPSVAGPQLVTCCHDICNHCLAPSGPEGPTRAHGTDNMTIIVVRL